MRDGTEVGSHGRRVVYKSLVGTSPGLIQCGDPKPLVRNLKFFNENS